MKIQAPQYESLYKICCDETTQAEGRDFPGMIVLVMKRIETVGRLLFCQN
jgi:hypothetical protein